MGWAGSLDNRELATLVWLTVGVLAMCVSGDLRRALRDLVAALAAPAIVLATIALAAYCAGLAWLASALALWQPELLKDTAVWFLTVGVALLMNVGHVSEQDDWFRREARRAIRISIFVAFFVNLAAFSLPLELVAVPLLTLLATMSAAAASRDDLLAVKRLIDYVLGLAGFVLIAHAALRVLTHWDGFVNWRTLSGLLLPVWLTIGALPFIFLTGAWSSYQVAFGLINQSSSSRRRRSAAKVALVCGLQLRATEVGQFRMYEARTVATAATAGDARRAVRAFRAGLWEERQLLVLQADRLRRFAGVAGTNAGGQRLDQREFDDTKEALQYLAVAQAGWYANDGHRFREDLLEILGPFAGLPTDHGISLIVASDGHSWWAWRRTVTGWCFAIGAAEPPPDEWLYDGPEPPRGFPGADPTWGERWGLGAKNWTYASHSEREAA